MRIRECATDVSGREYVYKCRDEAGNVEGKKTRGERRTWNRPRVRPMFAHHHHHHYQPYTCVVRDGLVFSSSFSFLFLSLCLSLSLLHILADVEFTHRLFLCLFFQNIEIIFDDLIWFLRFNQDTERKKDFIGNHEQIISFYWTSFVIRKVLLECCFFSVHSTPYPSQTPVVYCPNSNLDNQAVHALFFSSCLTRKFLKIRRFFSSHIILLVGHVKKPKRRLFA